MARLVIFLRGINVNGITIKMADLRRTFESMSYRDVRTVLASGNVVVTTQDDLRAIQEDKQKIEEALSVRYQYAAHIVLKSAGEIRDILVESKNHAVPQDYHHYILLHDLPEAAAIGNRLQVLFEQGERSIGEQLILGQHGIYWIVPQGATIKSDFGKQILGQKAWRAILTSRTIQTIQKVSGVL